MADLSRNFDWKVLLFGCNVEGCTYHVSDSHHSRYDPNINPPNCSKHGDTMVLLEEHGLVRADGKRWWEIS